MAEILLEGRKIAYSVTGNGKPLVVLNGIFMTANSWQSFVPVFSKNNSLILIDFIDQGQSAQEPDQYTHELQIEVVHAVLKELAIENAVIMGISYGGEVALGFALAYPTMVDKLILANTCAYTDFWLNEIGKSWEYAMQSKDGRQFFKTCIPIVYSPEFFNKNKEWAKGREDLFVKHFSDEVYDSFIRLTRSAETYDVRDRLKEISAKTLVISSELDFVTPLTRQIELVAGIKNASHVIIKGAGHASMYEAPDLFASLVLGFANIEECIVII